MIDPLNKEIVRRIFLNFGYIANKEELGKHGLSHSSLLREETISGTYETGEKFSFSVNGGSLDITESSKLECLIANISDENFEFAGIFYVDNVLYGIKLLYDDVNTGMFLSWVDNSWKPISTYWKAKILSGTELIVSYGLIWKPLEKTSNLDKLIKLVNWE